MVDRRDAAQAQLQARRVERVLRAEQAAGEQLAQARREAQGMLEAARDNALADVNRAGERIARWQARHAEALAGRLSTLRAQADRAAQAGTPPGDVSLAAAVQRVARQMTTGAAPDPGSDDAV